MTAVLGAVREGTGSVRSLYRSHRPYAIAVMGVLAVVVGYVRAPNTTQFLQFTMLGIAFGAIYAIAAAGLVLTYTTTGVFNFAHGAVGMISAFVYWQLSAKTGIPAGIAAVIVLGIVGPALGLLLELMFRRFRGADVGTSIVLTVAVTVLCIGASQQLFKASEAHNLGFIFGERTVTIFKATISYDNAAQILLAIGIAVGLRALLFGSRLGTAMRAVVDNPDLAALNGASPTLVARASWILGTELAVVAGILVASGTNLEAITLTFFVVNAYGAAVFGKLKSLPLTFAGAVVLGITQNWSSAFLLWKSPGPTLGVAGHDILTLDPRRIAVSLPGIFLFLALLALPQAKLSVGRVVGRTAPSVPGLTSSIARGIVFVAAMAALVQIIPSERLTDATTALVYGVILLSLVLLTGFSGQVSLAQIVFVAIGAWGMGKTLGGSSPLGMLVGGLAAVPFGALVALPALRLQGLYLALVTFGFAAVSRDLIVEDGHFYGSGSLTVGRLHLLGIDFSGDRAFFVLCAIVFALLGVAVLAIKRGAFGRRLAALRDSPAACATLGLDIRLTKLLVFTMSAFVAGVAGALLGGLKVSVSDVPFEPINNIVLLLFAVVGGITTVSGALLGGSLFALLPYIQAEHKAYAGLAFAVVAAVAIGLGRQPNGLAGMVAERLEPFLGRRSSGATTSTDGPAASTTSTTSATNGRTPNGSTPNGTTPAPGGHAPAQGATANA